MTPALPFDPDAFLHAVGPAPRRQAGNSSAGFLSRLLKSRPSKDEERSRLLFETGDAMWGFIFEVYNEVRPGSLPDPLYYGLCLVAPDLSPQQACYELPRIMGRLKRAAESPPSTWDAEQQKFMAGFSDGTMADAGYSRIPHACHGGIDCGLLITRFPRAEIPGGSLHKQIIPLLVSWDAAVATVLPAAWWPADFQEFWFATPEATPTPEPGEPGDVIAFEGSGLPADAEWLNYLHGKVTNEVEAAGLSCLFVNTGHIQDADRSPVAGSGEIQVLGKASEGEALLAVLHRILTGECAEIPDFRVIIHEMPLDEFFDSFGHMFDEN